MHGGGIKRKKKKDVKVSHQDVMVLKTNKHSEHDEMKWHTSCRGHVVTWQCNALFCFVFLSHNHQVLKHHHYVCHEKERICTLFVRVNKKKKSLNTWISCKPVLLLPCLIQHEHVPPSTSSLQKIIYL